MKRFDYGEGEQHVKIDLKDRRILEMLSEDSRIPLTKIAKRVRLSRDAVNYRIKRLERKEAIQGFFPNIKYEKLGFYIFHVCYLIREEDKEKKEALIKFLCEHPNIYSVIEYMDTWDLEITLIAKDLTEFDKILLEIMENSQDIIRESAKFEVIKRFNLKHIPSLIEEEKERITMMDTQIENNSISETDYKILEELSKNARKSTYEIGQKLGLSADTVTYRLKKLKEKKIIRDFTILVNLSKLRYYWFTYCISLKFLSRKEEKKVEEFLQEHQEIIRTTKTLGAWDLIFYMAPRTTREYHKTAKKLKDLFGENLKKNETWLGYKEHVYKPFPEAIKQAVK